MKKAIVFFGGVIENYFELNKLKEKNYDIFCADGGAKHAKILGLIPKIILGDFDSIDKTTKDFFTGKSEFINYPKEKDFTDGELIIEKIYNDYDEISVLGAFGGEHHHLLGNIFLLEKFPKIKLLNDFEEIFYLNKSTIFSDKKDFIISFIPLDKSNVITLKGFRYNLQEQFIKRGDSTTLSNVFVENIAIAEVISGSFLGILQRSKNTEK